MLGIQRTDDKPGLREYLRQNRTRVHMNDPSNKLERHAEDIDVHTTIMNLQSKGQYLMDY